MTTEAEYVLLAKKVSKLLLEGRAPYRVHSFFKEMFKDLPIQLESGDLKKILDSITTVYNEKVKQEKLKEKGGTKKTAKATLNSGKQVTNNKEIN